MNITAGKFKGQKIIAPDEKITRPTLSKVRMSVFNTLQAMTGFEGKTFLDMYAGSGIMALEAVSRGFKSATAIEKHPKVAAVIKNNYQKFNNSNLTLLIGDSLKIAHKIKQKFDVIYIDPPYFLGIYEQSIKAIRQISNGIVILEHVTDVDFGDYELIKQKKIW
jgi:16S rRNA (guanine966-N2)-methyltransferase